VITKYYFAGGKRVAMDREGVVQWLVGDHLGTTSLMLNANGTVHSEARHYPYGEERWRWPQEGTFPIDYRFTGQRSDSGLGLYFMGARQYDPALGRWISADTIVPNPMNPQAFNRYGYVYNNPFAYIDKDGHNPLVVAALVGGGIGFLVAYVPQVVNNLRNDESLADAAINKVDWGKVAGGTVAGAVAGGTMGIATHLGAGIAGTMLAGGFGGAAGGQVGAWAEAGTDQFLQWASGHGWDNTELLQGAFEAGFMDPTTFKYDALAGCVSAGAGFTMNKLFSSAMRNIGDMPLEGVVPEIGFLPGRSGMVVTVELAGRRVVLSGNEFENLIKSVLIGAYEPVSELLEQLLEGYIQEGSQP